MSIFLPCIHRILVIYSYLQPSWNGTEIFLTVAEWCSYMVTGFVVILKLPFQQQESNPSHPFSSYMSRQLLVLKITVGPLFLARLLKREIQHFIFVRRPQTALVFFGAKTYTLIVNILHDVKNKVFS